MSFVFCLNCRTSLSLGVEEVALRASGAVASLEISARRGMPVLAARVTAVSFQESKARRSVNFT